MRGMDKKILITGISGFIGGQVGQKLCEKYQDITAFIRPGTLPSRISNFENKIQFVPIDLADTSTLKQYLTENRFDCILHIGALRGGRHEEKDKFFRTNVLATQVIAEAVLSYKSRLIFCSSVGVFGAAPTELPATNQTERQYDNYYHTTKIQGEAIIQQNVMNGLDAVIVRPSITYGKGDYGFPYTMVKLVKHHLMFLPDKLVWIHLADVNLVSEVFTRLVDYKFEPGAAYNVADREPLKLHDLVHFISRKIHNQDYPERFVIDQKYFAWGEKIAQKLHNELWTSRFQLLSKSWMFEVTDIYHDLHLPPILTIPNFESVIHWFLKK
jgi:nucleoside-diphosphate-sugar epimerase